MVVCINNKCDQNWRFNRMNVEKKTNSTNLKMRNRNGSLAKSVRSAIQCERVVVVVVSFFLLNSTGIHCEGKYNDGGLSFWTVKNTKKKK